MGATRVETERRKQWTLPLISFFLLSFPLHMSMLEGEHEPFLCSIQFSRERYLRHLVVLVLFLPTAAEIDYNTNNYNCSNNPTDDASVKSYVHGSYTGRKELVLCTENDLKCSQCNHWTSNPTTRCQISLADPG